jgi:ATP-dependent Zn protease
MGRRQLENDGMSNLGDFLLEALDASISLGPSSDRGIVARFSGGSFLLLVATVWLLQRRSIQSGNRGGDSVFSPDQSYAALVDCWCQAFICGGFLPTVCSRSSA